MKPINCLIIDDTELDRLVIEDYISTRNDLHLAGSFSNALESVGILQRQNIGLLFLDISMPVINGIQFLKKLEAPPLCIFITSHTDYALEAFDVNAFDYLLKPLKKDKFDATVQRVIELLSIREKALHYDLNVENDVLTFKEGNNINRVFVNDILYLEALTNYTKVVTADRKYITLKNLKNLLEDLPRDKFLRVHRSYAVAVNKITSVRKGDVLLSEIILPMGKTYRQDIIKILNGKTDRQVSD
jgi:DNA-binding LytR/AlgR family response regulator